MERNELFLYYGNDPAAMAYEVCTQACLAELIGDVKKRIGLKPNLVVASPAQELSLVHI